MARPRRLTIKCTCGNVVGVLKVTGDIPYGVITESGTCSRCRAKRTYSMGEMIGMDSKARRHLKALKLE